MALIFYYFDNIWIGPVNAITLFCCICWFIWKAHNTWVFDGIWQKPNSIVSEAVALLIEGFLASLKFSQSRWDARFPGPSLPSWKAPCPGFVKLNCNG